MPLTICSSARHQRRLERLRVDGLVVESNVALDESVGRLTHLVVVGHVQAPLCFPRAGVV